MVYRNISTLLYVTANYIQTATYILKTERGKGEERELQIQRAMDTGPGYSYSTYMNWDLWVPVAVSLLVIILTVLVIKTSILWFKCFSGGKPFLSLAYHFAKLVLRDSLQKETSPPVMKLYDRKISPVSLTLLFTIAPALFIPAFVSFWGSFLVEETFACDPGIDCFARDPGSFGITDRQPLINCTDHENDTIICFQFVFDYAAGFASMGGFLAVAITCLKVYGILLVGLLEIIPSDRSQGHGKCHFCKTLCSILTILVFFLAPILLAAFILLITLLVPLFSNVIFQSNASTLKFTAYCLSLVYVGPMAGACIVAAIGGTKLSGDDLDGGLEAGISASFNLTHQSNAQERNTITTTSMGPINVVGGATLKPAREEWKEPDFKPPLVGSVLSSYSDVTTIPTRHSESSLLLGANTARDYQTTT